MLIKFFYKATPLIFYEFYEGNGQIVHDSYNSNNAILGIDTTSTANDPQWTTVNIILIVYS